MKESDVAGDMIDQWFVPANANMYPDNHQTKIVKKVVAENAAVVCAFN